MGTIINTVTIVIGSLIGILLKGKLSNNIIDSIIKGLALCVIYIGISGTLNNNNPVLIIVSITIGIILGEIIDIDKRLEKLGQLIEGKFKSKGSFGKVGEAFVSSTLLFCVGAMAIVGSLESGLKGDNTTLYAKSILDGITSIIFASTLGFGVILSAISVFLYQGCITLGASYLSVYLNDAVINNMSAVGSIMIMALGFNILGVTKIKVANMLPAVIIPILYSFI